ncbi:MAG: GGDEF domain-containing protein, partial [Hyphomicrobium sp.]|nr:GGDEF domain-containing protein [Hyphomicrobium sp.]
KERDALSWAATHDALTRVANRQSFESVLAEQLSERRRHESACALFIDLDGFKPVNDSAGHAAGDQLLKDVASIVRSRIRADDVVARLGGDEFGVLLRRCTLESALDIAESIRARVEAHTMQWDGARFQVRTSIGVVHIDAAFKDVASVIASADAACYAAKRSGRNAVRSGGFLRLV